MSSIRKRRRKSKLRPTYCCDLDVHLVLDNREQRHSQAKQKNTSMIKRGSKEEQYVLIERLIQTGYSIIALSHSIKGNFNPENDLSTKTMPSFVWNDSTTHSENNNKLKFGKHTGIEILKRLNVIIQKTSELSIYCSNLANDSVSEALKSYDIIAMTPQDDETFTSICTMTNLFYCDIITLDYTSGRGGIQLPFKLRASDIKSATNRGIVFELPYGPALTDPSKRKAFVQTARLFLNAIVGVKDDCHQPPKIIISSGSRVFNNNDLGVMSIRSSSDMINFANVVLGFDHDVARDALSSNASWVVERGQNRSQGKVTSSSSLSMVGAGKRHDIPLSFQVVDPPFDGIIPDPMTNNNNNNNDVMDEQEDTSKYSSTLVEKDDKVEFDHDEDFLKL